MKIKPHGKIQAYSFETITSVIAFWTRSTAETSNSVVASHGFVARVCQIAFINVRARCSVASQASGARSAAVIRRAVDIEAFHVLKMRMVLK